HPRDQSRSRLAPRRTRRRNNSPGTATTRPAARRRRPNARRPRRPRPGAPPTGALAVARTSLQAAITEVATRDPVLTRLIAHVGPINHRPRDPDGPFGAPQLPPNKEDTCPTSP